MSGSFDIKWLFKDVRNDSYALVMGDEKAHILWEHFLKIHLFLVTRWALDLEKNGLMILRNI